MGVGYYYYINIVLPMNDIFQKNNQMQENATKFHYVHTSKDTDTDFQCEGINIKAEDMVKMLGINIDKKLKFNSHVTEVIRKCAYQLNA